MPKASTYQCPNCGGVVTFDPTMQKLKCEFCETVFEEHELEGEIPVGDEVVERWETKHATTVEDFLERAPWEISDDGSVNASLYVCPSCAASLAADQSTVSMSCPYCGNNMLVQGLASPENIPKWVLPFALGRDEAEERMRRHFEHKWYLSRAFEAQLQHLQGMYIPYHLYDMSVEGHADYIGYETETNEDSDGDTHTVHYYYAIKRAGHASFERVPIDGSSKMPDGHMDAIAPFYFNKMKPFSPSYVAGYLMEVADEDATVCQPRAESLVRASFENDLRADAARERRIDGIETTVAQETLITLGKVTSAVLPVWMMYCTWEDHRMLFAVNGDTGKCVGDLPVEGKRRAATIAVTALALTVLAVFLLVAVLNDSDNQLKFAIGAVVVVILGTVLVDAHFMSQMRTAVEARDAGMSYDANGLVVTERWRGKRRGSAGRAKRDL